MTILTFTLTGSDTATCGDHSVTTQKRPICKLARVMLSVGYSPYDLVIVMRGEEMCFTPATVAYWAGKAVSETDRTSAKLIDWAPLPERTFQ